MDDIKIYPDFREFSRLAKKGNLIPVYTQIFADLETPVLAFLKVCQPNKYAYLLESVESREKIGRYSFLSTNPSLVLRSKGLFLEVIEFKKQREKIKYTKQANPLDEIRNILQRFKYVNLKQLPRFCGGFVGYISYDAVRLFEDIPDKNQDDLNIPDCIFMLSNDLVIFDHIENKIIIVSNVFIENGKSIEDNYAFGVKRIRNLTRSLSSQIKLDKGSGNKQHMRVGSNYSKESFCRIVRKAKEYIRKGDVIQVVLSQRFKIKISEKAINIYRKLRSINPSPYMYYLKFPGFDIVGSSPEMLVRCEDGNIETRPIAGTRPRGESQAEDQKLAKELLMDKKERAEHLMLVDLGRNDLGRVSEKGTVKVADFMSIEKYSHVMHIVSSVVGRLDDKLDIFQVLSSAFPAGTVAGAPKIRAMEIIDELEGVRRGPYAGCVGYFSFSGNMDTCITIRTIIVKDGFGYVQAGAGIVSDSKPMKEFMETKSKARALIDAITNLDRMAGP